MTDVELVQAFKDGDQSAFVTLIERHRGRAVAVARVMSGDVALAEDAAQEATYQAYFEISSLREPGRFGSWLCGIAVNLTKMALRRQRFVTSWYDLAGGRYVPGTPLAAENDPELAYEITELRDAVAEALQVLSADMRTAVWLHYVDGLTYQEVSAITGIPSGRLRVMSHRARRRLQVELAQEWRPRTKRRQSMVEVKLHDVLVMEYPEQPGDPISDRPRRSWVAVLKSVSDEKAFCIWVGPSEGGALALGMTDIEPPRPQTYTLMARLIEGLGAQVERVSITDLSDQTFIARITLRIDSRSADFDARPSDALNLGQRAHAPMFVDEGVLERAALPVGLDIVEGVKARSRELFGAGEVEWRSGIEHMKASFEQQQQWAERWRAEAEARESARDTQA
jgi:RNA polymerase sigma factor (sigma-70 family)